MTTSELIQEFESSKILIDLRGEFEFPERDWIPDEVGNWLNDYCTAIANRATSPKMYMKNLMGRWAYMFVEEHDGKKFLNGADRDYFEHGNGSLWKVDPTVVKLADFYQMIVNAEAFPESYFDEVFG